MAAPACSPADVKPAEGKGFHFRAGYACHDFVMEMSSGLYGGVMNDKNIL
jgi:hypothetical protein